jgi:hypothetical protein
LPAGLTNLLSLDLRGNPLGTVELPEGLDSLQRLSLSTNSLKRLILPAGYLNIFPTIFDLRGRGLPVTLLPIAKTPFRTKGGDWAMRIFGDTGNATVLCSTNLTDWTEVGSFKIIANQIGAYFTNSGSQSLERAFYKVRQ